MPDELLAGKTTVVTGASRGIGQSIATRFAEHGADVVVCSRQEDRIGEVADELVGIGPGDVVGVRCDVTDSSDVHALIEATVDTFDGIDALVNNAGGSISDDNLHRLDEETWQDNIDVNLTSPFLVSKAALPTMVESGGGSIVQMSSVNGRAGIGLSAYSAARSGVFGLSRLIATQYGRHGIRSNVICPGTIQTESREDEMEETGTAAAGEAGQPTTPREQWIDQYPLGRFGRPGEVADAALFLASDLSSFVTGEELVVDGGLTAGLDWSFQRQIYEADDLSDMDDPPA